MRRLALASVLVTLGTGLAVAGELRDDRVEGRDDLRDLVRLERLEAGYARARDAHDAAAIARLDAALARAVAHELHEGRIEQREDRRERRASRREAAASGTPDDRRDLRDDRRDLRQEDRRNDRVRAIAVELREIGRAGDPAALDRKQVLIGELARIARNELAADRRERREDRRERREDLR